MAENPSNPRAEAKAAKAYAKATRPWYKKKRIMIPAALVVLAIIGGLGGGSGSGSDDDKPAAGTAPASAEKKDDPAASEADGTKAAPKPKTKKKPKVKAVKVTVAQVLEDYEENELAADTKYEGKTIEVTGTIDKIDKEIFGNDYVLNLSDGSEYSFLTVNCNDMSKKALSKLTVGDEVTAVGKFDDGGDLGVELKKCVVA